MIEQVLLPYRKRENSLAGANAEALCRFQGSRSHPGDLLAYCAALMALLPPLKELHTN